MKLKIPFPFILMGALILLNFTVYKVYNPKPLNITELQQTMEYTCPTHPQVVKDNPGNCPICSMKLIQKRDISKGVTINPNYDSIQSDQTKMKIWNDTSIMIQSKTKI